MRSVKQNHLRIGQKPRLTAFNFKKNTGGRVLRRQIERGAFMSEFQAFVKIFLKSGYYGKKNI